MYRPSAFFLSSFLAFRCLTTSSVFCSVCCVVEGMGRIRIRSVSHDTAQLLSRHGRLRFVYAVDEFSSLSYLKSWIQGVEQLAPTAVKFLVGNKVDLKNREVDTEAAELLALNHDIVEMFTTSAKTGEDLEHAFTQIATKLHNSMGGKTSASPSSIDLAEDNLPKKMGCCCYC